MPISQPFELQTLGQLRLTGPEGELLPGRRKELVLLAYLARKSPRPVPRAELSALLWGERDEAKARQSLRHALYQLRQVLGDALAIENDSVAVVDGTLRLDVTALERDGRTDVWEGDFLAGCENAGDEWFRTWLEGDREALRRRASDAFAHAVRTAREGGDAESELSHARRWAESFPLDSRAHCALVESEIRSGSTEAARRSWSAHITRLRQELDEPPPVELLRLGEELDRLERKRERRRPGSAALFTPDLVGRDAILASLLDRWSRVGSAGAVVVIEGEEGIGKSRLAAELARRVGSPELLVIDDLLTLDEAARQRVLEDISSLAPGRMVVVNRRLDEWPELGRALDLGQIPHARRIRLSPLTEKDVTQLLDSMLEIGSADRDALASRITAESGGNPFYALELTSALADSGVLSLPPSGRWQLAPGFSARTLPIPSSIRAAVRMRIAELSEEARTALTDFATGPQPISGERAAMHSEHAVDELLAHRLLRPGGGGSREYEFAHALTRRVASEQRPRKRSSRRLAAWLSIAGAVVIALAVGLSRARSRAAEAPTAGLPRVAVLDLSLVAPDSAEAWLASGLSEEITSSLSRFTGIRVKSRGALRNLPPRQADPVALGRDLHVDYLVEGSLRRAGDHLVAGVRLTSTRDGFQVWAHEFGVTPGELPGLHTRIAALVASRIGGSLSVGDSGSVRMLTASAEAYEYYLRGTYLLARRTPFATEQAILQFQRALQLDSMFTAAAARVAYGYYLFLDWGWRYRGASPEPLLPEGIALVDRALRADSSSAEAWLSRAYLLAIQDPVGMTGAVDAFERAAALDPRSVEVQYQFGQALMALGHWDRARAAYRKAIALEPERAQTYISLGSIERKEGHEDAARRLFDSALVVEPGAAYARSARSRLRLADGDLVGALDDAETAVRTTQGFVVPPHAALAAALARSGDSAGASREIAAAREAIVDPAHPSPTEARWIGAALLVMGRPNETLDLLERARPRGAWLWFYFAAADFDSIREDPRFVRVMKEARPGYPN